MFITRYDNYLNLDGWIEVNRSRLKIQQKFLDSIEMPDKNKDRLYEEADTYQLQ